MRVHNGELYNRLRRTLTLAIAGYLTILAKIETAPDFASAREMSKVLMKYGVADLLMDFARIFWESREEVSIKELDGTRLTLGTFRLRQGDHRDIETKSSEYCEQCLRLGHNHTKHNGSEMLHHIAEQELENVCHTSRAKT